MSSHALSLRGEGGTPPTAEPPRPLRGLIGRLVSILDAAAIESASLDSDAFRRRLADYQARIEAEQDAAAIERLGTECVQLCEDYFRRSRSYLAEREQELTEVIDLLREALSTLVGESSEQFQVHILQTSERLNRLRELDDIRTLKSKIAEEVEGLKRAVADKQKRDQEHYANLSKRVVTLESHLTQTRREAELDPLTEIPNRRGFDRVIEQWIARYQAEKKPFVLGMIDLDDFKKTNDQHGHLVGDRVLKCAAELLAKSLRADDFVARYGGEEFVVLLGGTKLAPAEPRIRSVVEKVASTRYKYRRGIEELWVEFTISAGLAEYAGGEASIDLVRRADEALYQAKKKGKNCVVARRKGFLGILS